MRNNTFSVYVECELDAEYFADWDDLSPEIKAFWHETTKQPACEGSGFISTDCNHCPFCLAFEME